MHLGPQHFQAQNRYFESIVQFASEALAYEPWGLSGLQMDQEALKNGVFALVYARGIMPDGLVFLLPESDTLPDSRNLGDALSPVEDHTDVYLAIPPAAERGKLVDGGERVARGGLRPLGGVRVALADQQHKQADNHHPAQNAKGQARRPIETADLGGLVGSFRQR